jgi:hypothetical protein
MDVILLACLLIVVFLIVLNAFLNGASKTRIDAVLSVALLCVLGAQFYWFGWKGPVKGVAVALIAAGALRPLAQRLAVFLLAHPPKQRL